MSENENWNTPENITIPDFMWDRYKTNIPVIDNLMGGQYGGLFKMCSFTIYGEKGAGKTTFLLQLLEQYAQNGLKVAYVSNEEMIIMLAIMCRRLNVQNVQLVNENDIDKIEYQIKQRDLDIVILDSLPGLITDNVSTNKSEYVVAKVKELTSDINNPLVIGIVLHATTNGKAKGGTSPLHVVDINFELTKGNPLLYGNDQVRELLTSKNRTGPTTAIALQMTAHGYDFGNPVADGINTKVALEPIQNKPKVDGRSTDKNERMALILDLIGSKNSLTLEDIMLACNVAEATLKQDLNALRKLGVITKHKNNNIIYWSLV